MQRWPRRSSPASMRNIVVWPPEPSPGRAADQRHVERLARRATASGPAGPPRRRAFPRPARGRSQDRDLLAGRPGQRGRRRGRAAGRPPRPFPRCAAGAASGAGARPTLGALRSEAIARTTARRGNLLSPRPRGPRRTAGGRPVASPMRRTELHRPLPRPGLARARRAPPRRPRSSTTRSGSRLLRDEYGYEIGACCVRDDERIEAAIPFARIKSRLTGNRLVALPFSDHCPPAARRRRRPGGARHARRRAGRPRPARTAST